MCVTSSTVVQKRFYETKGGGNEHTEERGPRSTEVRMKTDVRRQGSWTAPISVRCCVKSDQV